MNMIKLKSLIAMTVFFGLACCFIANGMSPSARAINAEIKKIGKKKISDDEKADLVRAFISDQLKNVKATKGQSKDQVKDAILAEVEGANAAAIQEIKDAIQGLKSTPPAPPDPAIAARAELKDAIAQAQTDLLKIASVITDPLKQPGGPLSKAGGTKLLTALEKSAAYKAAKAELLDALVNNSKIVLDGKFLLGKTGTKTKEVKKIDLNGWVGGLDEAGANTAKAQVEGLLVPAVTGAIKDAANKFAAEVYKAAVSKLVKVAEDKVGDNTKATTIEGRVDTALKDADNKKTPNLKDAYDAKMAEVADAIKEAKKGGAAGYAEAKKLDGLVDDLEKAAKKIEKDKKGAPASQPGPVNPIIKIEFQVDPTGAGAVEIKDAGNSIEVVIADPSDAKAVAQAIIAKLIAVLTASGVVGYDEAALKFQLQNTDANGKSGDINTGSAEIVLVPTNVSPAQIKAVVNEIRTQSGGNVL